MDLNGVYFPSFNGFETDNFGDTTLHLNCIGDFGDTNDLHFISSQSEPGSFTPNPKPSGDGCGLVLGLGPTPMSCSNNEQTKLSSSSLLSDSYPNLKPGLSGETGRFSFGCLEFSSAQISARPAIPVFDEGSTSAKNSGGYMPSLLLSPRTLEIGQVPPFVSDISDFPANPSCSKSQLFFDPSYATDYTTSTLSGSSVVTSVNNARPHHVPKRCRFTGCSKGARGSSGLCIGHGGGHRCQKPGCNKGAESSAPYCKTHGGGKRCQELGCTKGAEGKSEFCIAHGGGPRCGYPGGCTKAARGKSGLCIRHGGGKRCKVEGCTRSAEGQAGLCIRHGGGKRCKVEGCTRSAEGQAGLCISHGGGRRCQFPSGCTKGAQGSTMFCKAHGGGKRCTFLGCTKGAEGRTPLCKAHGGGRRCMFDGGGICPKSVHGGTDFCVAHGGGKRCGIPGCTKSARGRTDRCVRHGGGKRCRVENCGKSAQGSTDLCKAHGGGKRCNWENGRCEKFARGRSGLCAAHNNVAQGGTHKKPPQTLIARDLFRGLVSGGGGTSSTGKPLSSGISIVSDCRQDSSAGTSAKQQEPLIPVDFLVPSSMKSVSQSRSQTAEKEQDVNSVGVVVPEGRVHGGSLLSLLGGNLSNAMHEL